MTGKLTHFDAQGAAIMVDVGEKTPTRRVAVANGRIRMCAEAFEAVRSGTAKKGDVLGVARVAGIMAVKRTAELIPMCHSLLLDACGVTFELHPNEREIEATCTVRLTGKTGVEMEALTGVSVALLTIYDMIKAVDRSMEITGIHLSHKSGGKSGVFDRTPGGDALTTRPSPEEGAL